MGARKGKGRLTKVVLSAQRMLFSVGKHVGEEDAASRKEQIESQLGPLVRVDAWKRDDAVLLAVDESPSKLHLRPVPSLVRLCRGRRHLLRRPPLPVLHTFRTCLGLGRHLLLQILRLELRAATVSGACWGWEEAAEAEGQGSEQREA